jgi:hypothetical protein
VASNASPIVHGEASAPGGIEDAVVLVRSLVEGGELVCTGALLAPNLLVTARHCVAYGSQGAFLCNVRGELVDGMDGGGSLGLDLPPNQVEVYGAIPPRDKPLARGARIISTLSSTLCVNDLAFVILDQSVALPALPLRLGSPALVGEGVTLVGYGTSEYNQPLDWKVQPRERKTGLVISQVGPDSVDQVTTIPPRIVAVEGPAGCLGDSGGPLMAEGTNAVLGVYSMSQGSSCADPKRHNVFAHVPPFRALALEAFAAAGASPIIEEVDEPDAGGDESELVDTGAQLDEPTEGTESGADSMPPEEPGADESSSGCGIASRRQTSTTGVLAGLLFLARHSSSRLRKRRAA